MTEESFEKSVEVSNQFAAEIKAYLQETHMVAPDDNSAINVYNSQEEAKRYFTLTDNIAFFFWLNFNNMSFDLIAI